MREVRDEPGDTLLAFRLVDYLPPALNTLLRTHWARRQRAQEECALRIRQALGAPPWVKIRGPVAVVMERSRLSGRPLDEDNAAASFKLVGDALESIGVLVNDKQIKELEVVQVRGRERWTEVSIRPYEE